MTKKEIVTLFYAAMIIIVVSVLITSSMYYFDVSLNGSNGSQQQPKKPFYFMAQSLPVCDAAIHDRYGKNLRSRTWDNLSTRFDDRRYAHLIFADIAIQIRDDRFDYYIVCTVSASTNELQGFEIIPLEDRPKLRL